MKSVVNLFLLMLIPSYNDRGPTVAGSTDTSLRKNNDSESDYSGELHDSSKSVKENIRWTPELKYELIDLWERADPLTHEHSVRLHKMWSQKHRKYSHITPRGLKVNAEKFIREWKGPIDEWYNDKLRILNKKRRFPWTPALRNSLLECFAQSLRNETKLKKLWDERYPTYAALGTTFLKTAAEYFEIQSERGRMTARPSEWKDKNYAELMDIWDETFPPGKKSGHVERIHNKWKQLHPELCNIKPRTLKSFANSLIQEDTDRRIARGERSEKLQRRIEYFEYINKRLTWTPKMKSNLLKCFHQHKLYNKDFHECWQELEPEYAHLRSSFLDKTARQFLRRKNRNSQHVRSLDEQHEERIGRDSGASSNKTLQLQLHQPTLNLHAPYIHHFGSSQYEYGESSRRTPQLDHFIPTSTSSYPHHLEGSHQGYSANLRSNPTSDPINLKQQSSEHRRFERRPTHQRKSQILKSEKGKEVLDLDLHL